MASKITSNGTARKASGARRGKAFTARATSRPPSSSNRSSNPQSVPLSIPGVNPPGGGLRLPPLRLELVGTRPPQKRWLREPNLLRPRPLHRRLTTLRAAGEGGTSGYRAHRDCAALSFQSAGPQNAAPLLQSVSVQLPASASQHRIGDSRSILYVPSYSLAGFAIRA